MPIHNSLISVVLPVYNGETALERALSSVARQCYRDWELLVIDDCSTDGTQKLLQTWKQKERRIRLFRTPANRGSCAARNVGLRNAIGEFICYLDHDDEFYPDYLETIARNRSDGDVLVFRYDLVNDNSLDDCPESQLLDCGESKAVLAEAQTQLWDPETVKERMFSESISAPLGVAHRKKWIERIGFFNEQFLRGGEWDLWKRLAIAGAEFVFVPLKSGRCHVWAHNPSPNQQPITHQGAAGAKDWKAVASLFETSTKAQVTKNIHKIAFVSPHCVLDFTNGAAVATFSGLRLLAQQGFDCQAFCGTRFDACEECTIEEILEMQGLKYDTKRVQLESHPCELLFTVRDEVTIGLFKNNSTLGRWLNEAEVTAFAVACKRFLWNSRPNVVWTYGGDPVSLVIHRLAKELDIPVVFSLHNFDYSRSDVFCSVDCVAVPGEYSRKHYLEKLGLACRVLPNVVNWDEAYVAERTSHYVTFINPLMDKGVYVFARIARELAQRRPDIPILVTQGRSPRDALSLPELELLPLLRGRLQVDGSIEPISSEVSELGPGNIVLFPFAPSPHAFYSRVYSVTNSC